MGESGENWQYDKSAYVEKQGCKLSALSAKPLPCLPNTVHGEIQELIKNEKNL